jgi:threonylcarbamoyladenosine tRNA methylthiotransferase MtaB
LILEQTKRQVKVAIETLGTGNGHEEILNHIDKNLKSVERVKPNEEADIYMVNSCSFKGNLKNRFLKLITRYKNKSPQCKVVAIGCDTDDKINKLNSIDGIDIVLGNIYKYDLESLIKHLNYHDNKLPKIEQIDNSIADIKVQADKTRAHLSINFQSRDYFCQYCTDQSKEHFFLNPEEILLQARMLVKKGVKEIVLTGNRIGEYKSSEDHNIIDVLKQLENIPGIERLKLASLEIENITDEFIEYISESEKYLSHIHVLLRSGSNKVLKELGANYRRKHFTKLMQKFEDCPKDLNIGVDVIVGCPSESDKEFEITYDFLSEFDIAYFHVFPFSGTVTKLFGIRKAKPISIEKKLERKQKLKELSDDKKFTFIRKNLETRKKVLFSDRERFGYLYGLTDNNIRVKTRFNEEFVNTIQHARIKMWDTDGIAICEVVNKIE